MLQPAFCRTDEGQTARGSKKVREKAVWLQH